jgi:hypothetical protein
MRRIIAIFIASVSVLQGVPAFALSAAPALRGLRAAGAPAPVRSGIIDGISQTTSGQRLSKVPVRLRNLDSGQVTATTTTSAYGTFTFARVAPATYTIELVDATTGAIIGTSAATAVSAGATTTTTVAATAAAVQGATAAGGGGIGTTAAVVTTVAAVAGITGIVAVVARDDASPSR